MRRFLLLLAVCGTVAAADLTVGTAVVHSGQKVTGVIEVPAGVDTAANIPVILIGGAKPGPVLALVAGSHGTEYASIIALEKLAQSAEASDLAGTLIIVPLVNLASFAQKTPHLNPVDGKNMNRFYPGKSDGTQTERASWAITKQVIEKSDYLIDFHGGDLDENMRKYAYWADTGNSKRDEVTRGMVLAFGFDHIIIQHARPSDPRPAATTLSRYTADSGKPAIAVEAGHAGTTLAEDVDALVDGSWNVMRHLKMLPGKAAPVEHPLWMNGPVAVTSEHEGVFYPLVLPEAYVEKGARLGYLTDYFGNRIEDAISPVAGVIVYVAALPSMKKGDTVANVGEIALDPAKALAGQ
jgi:uncharacterized protein